MKPYQLFLSIVAVFVMSSCSIAFADQIWIRGNDQKLVQLPDYLKKISPPFSDFLEGCNTPELGPEEASKLEKVYAVPMEADEKVLDALKRFAEILPVVSDENPNQFTPNTIFVHEKVKAQIEPIARELDNETLGQLYYLSYRYFLTPLRDGFSALIADKIQISKDFDFRASDAVARVRNIVQQAGFGNIEEDKAIQYLIKSLYNKQCGRPEFTINDYIGLYGMPNVNYQGKLSDLSGMKLTGIEGIEKLPSGITELHLDHNYIHNFNPDFPDDPFRKFDQVHTIHLKHNELEWFSQVAFHGLGNLTHLHLEHNKLHQLYSEQFSHLGMLANVYLHHNQLMSLPNVLFKGVPRLSRVELQNNQLKSIPKTIWFNLPSVIEVDLSHNQIQEIEKGTFPRGSSFQIINLSSNQLKELPDRLFEDINGLKKIDFNHNCLQNIPSNVWNLSAPFEVDLSHNRLNHPPDVNILQNKAVNLRKNALKKRLSKDYKKLSIEVEKKWRP